MVSAISTAVAETLYQWQEADGSLTFSPTPPPEGSGIEYKLMSTGTKPAADISLPDTTLSASQIASSQPSIQPVKRMLAGSGDSTTLQAGQPTPAEPSQQNLPTVNYAPGAGENLRNVLPQGISRAEGSAKEPLAAAAEQTGADAELLASQKKSGHCADLGKRIIALENRVTRSKTAEEMDNAILQISRYQKSYNTHCE